MGSVRNSFAGQCFRCGGRVEADAGLLSYSDSSHATHWLEFRNSRKRPLLQHDHCAEKYKGTFHHFKFVDQLAG